MNTPGPPPTLPAVVIGGWLGAGKTTLVNHLLRHAGGRRIAVLVNDFGEIAIDAELIEATGGGHGEVLSLAGGCICCSFGADLIGTLRQVAAREPRPDLVLIETSGVGLPAAVARTAKLAPGIRIEGVVVLADAGSLRRQAVQRYVGETVLQQLREADLVIVGKTDLVDATTLDELILWLLEAGLGAALVTALVTVQRGEVALGAMLALIQAGIEARAGAESSLAATRSVAAAFAARSPTAAAAAATVPAAAHYAASTRRFGQPVDVAALGAALVREGVLRAKGLLLDTGGHWQELQVAGLGIDIRPWRGPSTGVGRLDTEGGTASAAGHLVAITLRGS